MPSLWKLVRYGIAGWIPGGGRYCVICDHRVWRFMPYRSGSKKLPRLGLVLDGVGSDPDHFECPHCGANDRERHLLLYLRASGVLAGLRDKSVVHFAPEKRLSRFIKSAGPSHYTPCDLFPLDPAVKQVDMLQMPFESNSMDVLIANHVLEHVDDDLRALAEILRVLKPGGIAILQTPYSRKLSRTWEDPGIDTPEARLHAFGQEDHVRRFGRDIFDRIATVGFESGVQQHVELLGDVDAVHTGVNPGEPFFLFRKPA